jgi:hypothetical protein
VESKVGAKSLFLLLRLQCASSLSGMDTPNTESTGVHGQVFRIMTRHTIKGHNPRVGKSGKV